MSGPQIEFLSEEEREHFARARLGESVHAFLRSDVGRYIHGRAKIDVEEAKDELLECNLLSWFGRRKARKAQEKAATAQRVMRYCADAIVDGEFAFQQLSERENAQD